MKFRFYFILQRIQDLWRDLDRNSIPKSKLPDHQLFRSYKKELEAIKTLRRQRKKLEQEKQLINAKLVKYLGVEHVCLQRGI